MKTEVVRSRSVLSSIAKGLCDLVWPDLCLLCGRKLTEGETWLCLNCLYEFPRAEIIPFHENAAALRFMGKIPFERAATAFRYVKDSNLQQALELLKYKGEEGIGTVLGRFAGELLIPTGFLEGVDAVIPVPLHPKKEKSRGYNQCHLLAEGLSSVSGIPIDTNHLFRELPNKSQTTKSLWDRWENTHHLFGTKHPEELAGKHLLLLDDVLTSGSTLEACAKSLLPVPDVRISIFALALA